MFVDVIAFDCFGTVFDASELPVESIQAYVKHVIANPTAASKFDFGTEWYELPAHKDSAAGIKKLRDNGYKCVALSNGPPELIRQLSDKAGIEWDAIINLAAHNVYKPYSEAYKIVEKETGVKPQFCLMVTANPTFGDIEGAKSIGMNAQVIRADGAGNILDLAETLRVRNPRKRKYDRG
jgi:2-haloalkanoic acid dehalogenase type II